MTERADVVVIGMGPGGEQVAGELAADGLDVVGIEANLVGGECPYYGCIPSKMMIRAADALAEARRVNEIAGTAEVHPDLTPVATRIREEATTDWDDTIAADRFTDAGGRLIRGRARLVAPRTVQVGDHQIQARRAVVLNTGTSPAVPPIDGLDQVRYWTNRDAVRATSAPESMIVLGGGPIGAEFAQAFARFGTRVSVVEAAERLLPGEEPAASEVLAEAFRGEGIEVLTGDGAASVRSHSAGIAVQVGERELVAERLLVATGRDTGLDRLGLDAYGLDTAARTLAVDGFCRVLDSAGAPIEDLYAIGDVTGRGAFTHMSMYQAEIALAHLRGDEPVEAEYHAVPRVTFTDPEVGAVGLSEAQAREQGVPVRSTSVQVPSSTRGWIHGVGNDGVISLVAHAESRMLLGATSVGPRGGEVLGLLTLAVQQRLPVHALTRMIYAYPTFHRGVLDAAQQWLSEG
ncbi:MAG TPA: FAD-dependent oxidoreductase [Candidatus Ruania gallistercoris]|uniref:FAD-dependent oxidoreductase n=1 Tax=Candidatus Ruania gallistercoris TaxID=2838746 RepID=A0A9D2J444_9MICO|nr:FAD-dependent oxidoreductase [Candidatus Ruania gallistercoris]